MVPRSPYIPATIAGLNILTVGVLSGTSPSAFAVAGSEYTCRSFSRVELLMLSKSTVPSGFKANERRGFASGSGGGTLSDFLLPLSKLLAFAVFITPD